MSSDKAGAARGGRNGKVRTQAIEGGRFAVLVHGGAGHVALEGRAGHRAGAEAAARVGSEVLAAGGSALDAVVAAVRVLEDDPRFNAGFGASLNEQGAVELDASVMEGRTLRAGAVCALSGYGNPVAIARAVLDDGRHVLYASEGAASFAASKGFSAIDPATLVTESARAALERVRRGEASVNWAGGTVGAVAIDPSGLVAAATSTGGTIRKRVGRVGDSPLIGAGTYADDEAGAVSATGQGEAILRMVLAKRVTDAMRAGASARDATGEALEALAARLDASAGLIAVDKQGRLGLAYSTETMTFAALSELTTTVVSGC